VGKVGEACILSLTSNYSTDEERVELNFHSPTCIYDTVTALPTKFWHRYYVVEEDYIGDPDLSI